MQLIFGSPLPCKLPKRYQMNRLAVFFKPVPLVKRYNGTFSEG